jgi:hypothetical protein
METAIPVVASAAREATIVSAVEPFFEVPDAPKSKGTAHWGI